MRVQKHKIRAKAKESAFYGYLNLESTKTDNWKQEENAQFYGYLNLESTKTCRLSASLIEQFYGYLNLESTKTTPSVVIN